MKVQTLSVVVGGNACNANCPYCVSKMTPNVCDLKLKDDPLAINKRNLQKACRLARDGGVSTALITGKGEPTLYPRLLEAHVKFLDEYFPIIELQTNGVAFQNNTELLEQLYLYGLTTISISIVSYDWQVNARVLGMPPDYNFWTVVKEAKKIGLTVRLSVVMTAGNIDSAASIFKLVEMTNHQVDQYTFRSVSVPPNSSGTKQAEYAEQAKVDMEPVVSYFDEYTTTLLHLAHGAKVYDLDGDNVCLSNCLTESSDPDDIRQLIYFPDGSLRYSWTYPGARIF